MIVKLLVLFAVLHQVCGWGQLGHKIIAQIANDNLQSSASNIVNEFIGSSETLADIAPLPDAYAHTEEGRWSEPCHFCNLPRSATHFIMQYCGQFCVVKSIQNYTQILSSEESSPFQCNFQSTVEPCALEFLTHYTGDVHQPLHVGYGDDRGGNDVTVSWYGYTTNLHKVWDDEIIYKWTGTDLNGAVSQLEQIMAQNPNIVQQYISVTDPVAWADESFQFVRTTCYNYTIENGVPTLGDEYYDTNLPIVQQRLIAGGVRLGYLLNSILTGADINSSFGKFKDGKKVIIN